MADMKWGIRDKRGEWKSATLPEPSPLFQWPWKLRKIANYLFAPQGFLWPINLSYALLAIVLGNENDTGLREVSTTSSLLLPVDNLPHSGIYNSREVRLSRDLLCPAEDERKNCLDPPYNETRTRPPTFSIPSSIHP
jgi:hypothetical protein